MNTLQLKDILKSSDVLYVVKKENICKKTLNILKLFFHHVFLEESSVTALETYHRSRPSVVITDIDLIHNNGIKMIQTIRETDKTIPILILTHTKDEKYLFEAIKLNLVDYLLYPIDTGKLISDLNTIAKIIAHEGEVEIELINNYKYDFIKKNIITDQNQVLKLTKNEYRLLELLINNHNKTLSKKDIERYLWADEYITDSAFKSLFSRLRQKIGKESITNNFGVGYTIQILNQNSTT